LYDAAADAFRERETTLHSFGTFTQLSLVEGSSLRAPDGEHDDRADAYSLALVARRIPTPSPWLDPRHRLVLWPPTRPEDLILNSNLNEPMDERMAAVRRMLIEEDDGNAWHHDLIDGPLR
jgi:hypothetical protein